MTTERMLAQITVTDLDAALDWHGRPFDAEPDGNRMLFRRCLNTAVSG